MLNISKYFQAVDIVVNYYRTCKNVCYFSQRLHKITILRSEFLHFNPDYDVMYIFGLSSDVESISTAPPDFRYIYVLILFMPLNGEFSSFKEC